MASTGVAVRDAVAADLPQVVDLYRSCFPDDRKAQLGARACRAYFASVQAGEGEQLLVAEMAGAVVGFAILQWDIHMPPRRAWLRRSWPSVLRLMLRRPGSLSQLVRAARRPRRTDSGLRTDDLASLYLMAVGRSARRRGVGLELLSECARRAAAAGRRALVLAVRMDNRSAVRLYEGAGFRLIERNPELGSAVYRLQLGTGADPPGTTRTNPRESRGLLETEHGARDATGRLGNDGEQ